MNNYSLFIKIIIMEKRKLTKTNRKAMIFCLLMVAYPVIHWLIFYVYANLNSFALAFKRYDISSGQQVFLPFSGLFENFKKFFRDFFSSSSTVDLPSYFLRGALMHLCGLAAFPVGLVFAYLIYKKVPLSGTYKVILYLPAVVSGMVITLLFKYIIERAAPGVLRIFGNDSFPLLLSRIETAFPTIIIYSVWMGFPGSIVLNVGTMSRVPKDLIEYGEIEGISWFQEFYKIILPLMYPLLTVMLLGVFVGFFTAQGPLFALYSEMAGEHVTTFGYYMFTRVIGRNASPAFYGYTAAANMLIGIICVFLVYGTKWVLERFDPGAEF